MKHSANPCSDFEILERIDSALEKLYNERSKMQQLDFNKRLALLDELRTDVIKRIERDE